MISDRITVHEGGSGSNTMELAAMDRGGKSSVLAAMGKKMRIRTCSPTTPEREGRGREIYVEREGEGVREEGREGSSVQNERDAGMFFTIEERLQVKRARKDYLLNTFCSRLNKNILYPTRKTRGKNAGIILCTHRPNWDTYAHSIHWDTLEGTRKERT